MLINKHYNSEPNIKSVRINCYISSYNLFSFSKNYLFFIA